MSVLRFALGALVFVALHLSERKWPLRTFVDRGLRRVGVNLAIATLSFAAVASIYGAIVLGSVDWAERHGVGLLRWSGLPPMVATVLAVVLLDYTLWHWHWLNHRVPILWRFHAAHHADLDLDASTALRFHPGELLLAVPFRAIQVVVLGVAAGPLILWETLVLVFILFHHSNLRLPSRLDALLGIVVITPRVHGIHHSRDRAALHTNFGTLSSVWDRLHGLRVTDVAQEAIHIGLPGQSPDRLGVVESLAIPFHREAPAR
ncbi:MAG: sterol desaturase family protein [Deltaproteobacteria bacterium]|nr:sterol desaturase family protein [Deltaproteobacteria bacterium]